MSRLENYIPSRAYYENPAQASNDILRAKKHLCGRGCRELSPLCETMTMGLDGFTVNVNNRKWIISFFSICYKVWQYKSISFILYNKSNLIYSHFLSKTLFNLSKNAIMCYFNKSYL